MDKREYGIRDFFGLSLLSPRTRVVIFVKLSPSVPLLSVQIVFEKLLPIAMGALSDNLKGNCTHKVAGNFKFRVE